MNIAADILVTVLLVTGLALMGLAGIGLLRLPDAYARMNAAGKAGGLGVVCIVAGTALAVIDLNVGIKAAVAILLQLITVPIGSFAIARAAYRADTPLDPITAYDELAHLPTTDEGTSGPTRR